MEEWRDPALKGVGQVIFLNSTKAGAIVLGSLAIGDPYLACLATLGAVTSNGVAKAIQLDKSTMKNGLLAYNGSLMGCISAAFVAPQNAMLGILSTVPGAAMATVVTAALPGALGGKMPQWTFAFNMVALTQLVRVQPLLRETPQVAEAEAEAVTWTMQSVMGAPIVGVAQIFVVENFWTGAGILAGIATYSPQLAAHALAGSTIGSLTGLCLGAPVSDVAAGLYGFNSALTSMGVAVFFTNSVPTLILSGCGAAVTAGTHAGFKEVFFTMGGAPCLTLPFCVTMTGCYLLAGRVPGLVLASNPHSPEKNKE